MENFQRHAALSRYSQNLLLPQVFGDSHCSFDAQNVVHVPLVGQMPSFIPHPHMALVVHGRLLRESASALHVAFEGGVHTLTMVPSTDCTLFKVPTYGAMQEPTLARTQRPPSSASD